MYHFTLILCQLFFNLYDFPLLSFVADNLVVAKYDVFTLKRHQVTLVNSRVLVLESGSHALIELHELLLGGHAVHCLFESNDVLLLKLALEVSLHRFHTLSVIPQTQIQIRYQFGVPLNPGLKVSHFRLVVLLEHKEGFCGAIDCLSDFIFSPLEV